MDPGEPRVSTLMLPAMPSTLAQTATILAVGRQPSGESRAFSALRPGGLRRDRYQSRWHWANALQLMVHFSAFFAGFAPWREIPGRRIESRKGAKFAKVSLRFTRARALRLAVRATVLRVNDSKKTPCY